MESDSSHVDKGESIEHAAVREAREEAGLDVELLDEIGIRHDKVDMQSMLKPYGDVANGLDLMTCADNWIDNSTTLDKRVLIYTEQM